MFSQSLNSSQSILEINNANNNNNDLPQLSSRTLTQVFGPFYHSSKFFFKNIERNIKLKRIFFIFCLFLLIIRSIYYIIELFRTENLTITWAKTSIQLTFTLNGLSSFIWLYKYGNEYFNKFINELQYFIKNN
ncbi:hypothetical protein Mgra_00005604 [Meloidogyne graminicola]|uniref:Uncharacterized protein n=1 Tax=Meloidogyne graminicola TaxID=189291 RepID=A0A8S9ZNB5_9BILA|nr:hypothetical protein Mgra_00005604 [Meloidogyne graminicola]